MGVGQLFLIKNALGQVKKYKAMNKLQVPHFTLTNKLTQEQLNFFDKNGLIIFRKFISLTNQKESRMSGFGFSETAVAQLFNILLINTMTPGFLMLL